MHLYISLCVFSIHIACIEDFIFPLQPYFSMQSMLVLSLHMFDIISIQSKYNNHIRFDVFYWRMIIMLRAFAIISNYSRFAVLS